MIESGLLPKLVVYYSQGDDDSELQLGAASAFTNIASGTSEHGEAVVESWAIPHLIYLLGSPVEKMPILYTS